MKQIFTLVIFSFCFHELSAQNLITVENNGTATFYTSLDSAIKYAPKGANVYVPGGSFSLNTPISKGINLIGVGYNQDSTLATGFTQITSSTEYIYIISGADNGSITGVYFKNVGIEFGSTAINQKVTGFSISRCHIYGLTLGATTPATSTNLVFTENVFANEIEGDNVTNCFFAKNFIQTMKDFRQGSEFDNNIFLSWDPNFNALMVFVSYSIFKNNVFIYENPKYIIYSGSDNLFYDNLFVTDTTAIEGSDVRTLWNIPQSTIFVNQSGSTYNPHQDYHLYSTCPGKNYGTDGTDVGIYGTAAPFKQGGLPFNPHIQFQSIPTTTTGGTLNVNIKVAAQNN